MKKKVRANTQAWKALRGVLDENYQKLLREEGDLKFKLEGIQERKALLEKIVKHLKTT